MQRILSSWFIQGMVKATSDMWLKGWDERNGGNVSLRLDAADVEPYRDEFYPAPRCVELSQPRTELAGCWFLVTGSGKFFRNVQLDPADTLVLLQITDDGMAYHIHWGSVTAACRHRSWRRIFSRTRYAKRSPAARTA